MLRIDIPEDVVSSLKIPKSEIDRILKLDLAIALYEGGAISLGKARKLAGMDEHEFIIQELGKRRIERHYTEKELKEDIEFAKGSQ